MKRNLILAVMYDLSEELVVMYDLSEDWLFRNVGGPLEVVDNEN